MMIGVTSWSAGILSAEVGVDRGRHHAGHVEMRHGHQAAEGDDEESVPANTLMFGQRVQFAALIGHDYAVA